MYIAGPDDYLNARKVARAVPFVLGYLRRCQTDAPPFVDAKGKTCRVYAIANLDDDATLDVWRAECAQDLNNWILYHVADDLK